MKRERGGGGVLLFSTFFFFFPLITPHPFLSTFFDEKWLALLIITETIVVASFTDGRDHQSVAVCVGVVNCTARTSRTSLAQVRRQILAVLVELFPSSALTTVSLFPPGNMDLQPSRELYPIYLVIAGVGLLAFLGVGMVAARKRRHEHGRLWLPEGFKTTETSKKKRREPVGEDSVGLK